MVFKKTDTEQLPETLWDNENQKYYLLICLKATEWLKYRGTWQVKNRTYSRLTTIYMICNTLSILKA